MADEQQAGDTERNFLMASLTSDGGIGDGMMCHSQQDQHPPTARLQMQPSQNSASASKTPLRLRPGGAQNHQAQSQQRRDGGTALHSPR